MRVAAFLLDIENRYPPIQKARLDRVIEVGGFLVLVVGHDDANKFTSQGGRITRDLRGKFNKRVLIIEGGVNDRKFLEDLFSEQSIVTINIIWLPDGTTETRVVLKGGRRSRRLSKKRIKALKDIAKKVRNMDLRVEYEY
jgi:transcription antitermination factor NusA-like protein